MKIAGKVAVTVSAAMVALTAGALPAVAASRVPAGHDRARLQAKANFEAKGDWGYTQSYLIVKLPSPALTTPVRLVCFSAAGCSADRGMAFGPGDSNGHTIYFTGTTATSEPLVDSSGKTIGVCKATPSPSGAITCGLTAPSVHVPRGGWLGLRTTVTFTKFSPEKPGEPLAFLGWSDSAKGAYPGNNPDNDGTQIITVPVPDTIETWIDPTATAFAAGQSAQVEEAGIICTSEGFCLAKAGTRFFAALRPSGVYFPHEVGTAAEMDGFDVAFSCRFSDVGGYSGPGSNRVGCALKRTAVIDHYGESFVLLPVRAAHGSYPQQHASTLVLYPGAQMGGQPIGTDLVIVAPIAITSASSLPAGKVSTSYSFKLGAIGGVPTVKNPFAPPVLRRIWTVLSGQLPPGLSIRYSKLAGTPTRASTYKFTLQVSDGQGDSVKQGFSLVVSG